MRIQRHRDDWEALAGLDPLWAILSDPTRQFGGWDLEHFFASGEREIARVLRHAAALGYPKHHERALDFGCGVGRLTRALSAYFTQCLGVDISERMVRQAGLLNAAYQGCAFAVNTGEHLATCNDAEFDFVYCSLVLQHLPDRRLVFGYISEFIRVLRPGGLLVFQLPCYISPRNRLQLRRRVYGALRAVRIPERMLYERLRLNPMRMTYVPEAQVVSYLQARGAQVVEVSRSPGHAYDSATYYVAQS